MRQVAEIVLVILGVLGLGALKFGVPEEARQLFAGGEEAQTLKSVDDPWSEDYVDRPAASAVYFSNCGAARRAGAAPMRRGEPGYRGDLDRDRDGVACEPYR